VGVPRITGGITRDADRAELLDADRAPILRHRTAFLCDEGTGSVRCPACATENSSAARFCQECGTRLAGPAGGARAALDSEHKQITALFADVVDSTPLAERLGPEETHALIARCFDLMRDAVHQYEGTVSQFTGDGILALFGAPIAHEDHAQRAIRAALAIQQALYRYQAELQEQRGIAVQVRIGLNSGPVVVGTIGTDVNATYTAIGDTVNLASRIQGLAGPGMVVISEATHRLASGYFVTRDLGRHEVKGKEQAIGIREVLRPSRWRSRLDVYAQRGLSPLVGRERELRVLEERFGEACTGRGQIVFVSGDPGIGKSRLLHEFKRRLEGETLTWLEGRCIAYGRDVAYLPIVDILKESFAIQEVDADREIIGKAETGARALGGDVPQCLPYLKHLLSVDPGDAGVATMDPRLRKVRTIETLRALAVAGSAIRPIVIVIEDLHWIDRLSEDALAYLAEAVPTLRMLLLLTFRPGYEPPFGERLAATRLSLTSLSEGESARLAEGIIGSEHLPEQLERSIAHKAEGNPFFVEEVVKSLLEVGAIRHTDDGSVVTRPVDEIDVPDTVQDVIMARLDRLDEEPKRALQTAAVIGREFVVRLLDRTVELRGRLAGYLRELNDVELIYERSLDPELAYAFKHALTQDVAYASLLLARRRVLHRLVGEAIEALYADRLAEQHETLAYHYERGEVWDRAVEHLIKSGDRALAAFAPREAAAFYDRALAVLEGSGQTLPPERSIALHASHGQARFLIGERDRSAASYRAMAEIARAAGDGVQEGRARYQLSVVAFMAHHFEEAVEHAQQARLLAGASGDRATVGGALGTMAFIHAVTNNLDLAQETVVEALRESRDGNAPDALGLALHVNGHLSEWRGEHGQSNASWDEMLEIGRQRQVPAVLLRGLWARGLGRCGKGEYDVAIESLSEGLALAERLGDTMWRCRMLNTLGWLHLDLFDVEQAMALNQQCLDEMPGPGDPEVMRNAQLNLADCHLALGQIDEAQRILETVEAASRRRGVWGEEFIKWRYTQRMHAGLGEAWLVRGDPDRARHYADLCLGVAEETRSRRNIVKGRRLLGEILRSQDRAAEAEVELEEALHVAREDGNPVQLWKTLAALGRLWEDQGRRGEAGGAYAEAVAIVEGIAAHLADPTPRATLLNSQRLAELRQAVARCRPVDVPGA